MRGFTGLQRRKLRTALTHGAGALVLGAVAGPVGAAAVAASWFTTAATGRGLASRLLAPRPRPAERLRRASAQVRVPTGDAPAALALPGPLGRSHLLHLVRDLETADLVTLRRAATAYSMLSSVLVLATPLSLGVIFAATMAGGFTALKAVGARSLASQLLLLSGVFVVSTGLEGAVRHRSTKRWKDYASRIEYELRSRAYAQVQALDLGEIERRGSNALAHALYQDPLKVRRLLEEVPHAASDRLVALIVGGSVALVLVPVAWLLTLLTVPLPYLALAPLRERLRSKQQRLRRAEARVPAQLSDSLGGIAVVKGFNAEAFELERQQEAGEELRGAFAAAGAASSIQFEIFIGSYQVTMAVPMIAGAVLFATGALGLTPFIINNFLSTRLLMVSSGMRRDLDLYAEAEAAATRLRALDDEQPRIRSGPERLDPRAAPGDIRFEDVSFGYDEGAPLIEDLELCIPAGQRVAFVGPTGSGKSTLVKLLLRLYDVRSGRVLLGGRDLRRLDLGDLRRSIGLVSQDVHLFPGTVYENIRYGSPHASFAEVCAAAAAAEALPFIEALPLGFATVLSERAQNLSGGQRQRLSIARALLKQPAILILDEATSAVDNETEAAIARAVSRSAGNRTTILVAHRLSTVRRADCIHVMRDGRITESGSHDALIGHNRFYAHLWALQTGEEGAADVTIPSPAAITPPANHERNRRSRTS